MMTIIIMMMMLFVVFTEYIKKPIPVLLITSLVTGAYSLTTDLFLRFAILFSSRSLHFRVRLFGV